MQKQIILTADDYACCDFIDNAIEDAVLAGTINSVAVFVTHPDSELRIKELLAMKKIMRSNNHPNAGFGIGLHFSLTSGKALTGKSSLTISTNKPDREGEFREIFGYDFLLTEASDMRAELHAQLEKLKFILQDESIDHLSQHCGITCFSPGLFAEYAAELKLFNSKNHIDIAMRSPVSWFRRFNGDNKADGAAQPTCIKEPSKFEDVLLTPAAKEGVGLMLWKKLAQTTLGFMNKRKADLEKNNLRSPDLLCDLVYGQPGAEVLSYILDRVQDDELLQCMGYKKFVAEIMFHLGKSELNLPGKAVEAPHGINQHYFDQRVLEFEMLKNFNNLNLRLEQAGAVKAIYNDLIR